MKYKPLNDYILVKRDPIKDIRPKGSRIIIPETSKGMVEKVSCFGVILAIGCNIQQLKAKERILFARFAPTSVSEDDPDTVIMREEDVLARIE